MGFVKKAVIWVNALIEKDNRKSVNKNKLVK